MNPEANNSNNKKLKEGIILGVLLLALVIVVIVQFSGPKAGGAAPNDQPEQQPVNAAPAPAQTDSAAELSWIDDRRVANIVAEVRQARNPFVNVMAPPPAHIADSHQPPILPADRSPIIPESVDVFPPIGGGELFPPIEVTPPQVEPFTPPAPKFALSGVITTPRGKYAAITVDGDYYTVREGETVPSYNWTVTKIAIDQVTLEKEFESLTIRLSGGSQK